MKVCEQCGKEHDGSFGSGRFCCRSCSNRWVALHQSDEAKARKVAGGKANLAKGRDRQRDNPRKWSDSEKQVHSKKMKKVMSDEDIRRRISESAKGRVFSEETRKKISMAVKASRQNRKAKQSSSIN